MPLPATAVKGNEVGKKENRRGGYGGGALAVSPSTKKGRTHSNRRDLTTREKEPGPGREKIDERGRKRG